MAKRKLQAQKLARSPITEPSGDVPGRRWREHKGEHFRGILKLIKGGNVGLGPETSREEWTRLNFP